MFRHEGPGRSERHNRALAAYLAFVGGFVNSAGFVVIGSFTSHVTGNVGRFANDIASAQWAAAATALVMVIAFVTGAFFASMVLESSSFRSPATAYACALFCEGLLLALFTVASHWTPEALARLRDAEAAILCAAMGLQNSLVTRLSGAVVRTTHLTGVATDIGIELARWVRWWRRSLAELLPWSVPSGVRSAAKPASEKISLLVTIGGSFTFGAAVGALLAIRLHHTAMLIPSAAVTACAGYAAWTGWTGMVPRAEARPVTRP
jgi:uncharacterized membrane protein YoaK (UPF0700 family)